MIFTVSEIDGMLAMDIAFFSLCIQPEGRDAGSSDWQNLYETGYVDRLAIKFAEVSEHFKLTKSKLTRTKLGPKSFHINIIIISLYFPTITKLIFMS